jgi:nicotinamide-nucleotide amidase
VLQYVLLPFVIWDVGDRLGLGHVERGFEIDGVHEPRLDGAYRPEVDVRRRRLAHRPRVKHGFGLGAHLVKAQAGCEHDTRIVLVEAREHFTELELLCVSKADLEERAADATPAVLLENRDVEEPVARAFGEEVAEALDTTDGSSVDVRDPRARLGSLGSGLLAVQVRRDVHDGGRIDLEGQLDLIACVALEVHLTDTHFVHAAILTIGNEVVSGDTENTNASWLGRRLEELGVKVAISAAIPDELDRIVSFVRREGPLVDHLIVTGGLGGTPDDITREALAAAFGVPQELVAEVADDLRARFTGNPDYVTRWAELPHGARPLENPLGGAPGFRIENTWVLPGLPDEMKAMFDRYAEEFRAARPIGSWRRRYRTRESIISPALVEATARWPAVLVGSYPSFDDTGPEVEVVLKSSDSDALGAARTWLEAQLDGLT